eukprot:5064268-Karenia_brevis.AAC.1
MGPKQCVYKRNLSIFASVGTRIQAYEDVHVSVLWDDGQCIVAGVVFVIGGMLNVCISGSITGHKIAHGMDAHGVATT